MRSKLVLLVVVAAGCDKKTVVARYDGPMTVAYGDCAGPTVAWVSGPRPAEFTLAEAEELGGAGPSMADAGKPAAQPPVDAAVETAEVTPPASDSDDERRRAAVEQARDGAGVLGSTALTQGGAFASLTGTGDISSATTDENIYGGLLGDEAGERGWGFGRSGTGSTGFGTIGTGRYGTIGHHSGYGVGGRPGGMHGRSASVPTVSLGDVVAQGNLDKALIRRYVKRNIMKIQYCYEKELLAKPGISGTVTAQFFITPNGNVATSEAAGVDPNAAACVAAVIKEIEFPKPKGGGGVQVNYPFTFRPAANAVAAGSGASSGSADTGSGSAHVAAAGAATAVAPAAENRTLFRATRTDPTYKPGALNPLRDEDAALVECFRKTPVHHGTAVFELAYDGAGKVKTATVHGVDDKQLVTCVTAAAKRVQRASPAPTAERCSVAYGEMPVASMPTLDITADAITLAGKTLTDLRTAVATEAASTKIPAVTEAITARVAAVTSRSAPVVSVHGPLVVRPIDSAPMKIVNGVVSSILGAGDDFVLATQAAGSWSLFVPMALPVVPVPFGTGGLWNPVKGGRGRSGAMPDDERVDLSILVATDRVWIGLSRVNEFIEVKRDDKFATALALELAKQKESAFFADRKDVEIAGEDQATYGDCISVVKAAMAAGFDDWKLTTPTGLAARPQL